ncbi:MAG TPA: PAS domain-containing protein [Polyangiaceae bacterium]
MSDLAGLQTGVSSTGETELADFCSFASQLPGAWWSKDAAGRYVYVNPAAARSIGRPALEILGRTDAELFPKDVAAALSAHDERVRRTGENLEAFEEIPDDDGDTRHWYCAKFPLLAPDDSGARGTAGFAIDVTSVMRRARDAEAMLQQILDAMTDMVLVKGEHSRLEWANKAFLATYGMSATQLHGIIDAPFTATDHTQQYVKDDLYVFSTGRRLEIPEEPLTCHDGKVLTVHTVKVPIFDSNGQVIKTLGVSRDITDRKRMELELRHAQKLESVGRLAAGIAHEINTPIQFIGDDMHFIRKAFEDVLALCDTYQLFVQRAAGGAVSAADVAEIRDAEARAGLAFVSKNVRPALDAVQEGMTRVTTLVRALKEFGNPDQGERCEADINLELANTLSVSNNELRCVADVELDLGTLPGVLCCPGDLRQVFLNLLLNAAHSIADVCARTGQRGRIKVTTRALEDKVVVSISDTGTGIPEDLRSKIFDPFFTTKEVGKGIGQGLTMARMIVVAKHQGSLTFDTAMGVGTTFHVALPHAGETPETQGFSSPDAQGEPA